MKASFAFCLFPSQFEWIWQDPCHLEAHDQWYSGNIDKHIENTNNSQIFQLWQMQSVGVTDGEYRKVYF